MSGDWRSADPDKLDDLANRLWTSDDGGAYGKLAEIFDRARTHDASGEVARLQPLMDWLRDTAEQLRTNARILRGDTTPNDPLYASPDQPDFVPDDSPYGQLTSPLDLTAPGQDDADGFLTLADNDDLTEDDLAALQDYLDGNARNPDFAAHLVDEMGMEAFLRLAQRVEDMGDAEGAGGLLDSMGTVLTASMWVPGDMVPGSVAYDEWLTTPQGQRYQDRLNAFQDNSQQPLETDEDAPLGFDVAFGIMERSRVPMDQQFFDQTIDFFTTPIPSGDDTVMGVPDAGRLSEAFLIAASRSSPEVVDHYLFSSYGATGTPEAKAQWATDMMNRGDELTDLEVAQLSAVLAANQDDETFAIELATGLGAENLLQRWAELTGPGHPGDNWMLAQMQEGLGNALGLATSSDDPRMEQWEENLVSAGDQRIELDYAGGPYGFQVTSSLMQYGEWGEDVLLDYGEALTLTEQRHGTAMWADVTSGLDLHYGDGTSAGLDPVAGFMTALSRQPEAATQFFGGTTPAINEHNEDTENIVYYLSEREAEGLGEAEGERSGLDATGLALLAAGSGMDPNDPNATAAERSPAQDEIFETSLELLSGLGDGFPPEFRDSMAYLMVNHGEDVRLTTSGLEETLNGQQLFDVMVQVSRDQDAYGILSMGMNQVLVDSFYPPEGDPTFAGQGETPGDRLKQAGTTVGFMEEVRYQALTQYADDPTWNKIWSYHLIGGVFNFIPGAGDAAQRGVDVVTSKWLEDEQARIEDDLHQDVKETRDDRTNQLAALADAWYEIHEDWIVLDDGSIRDGYSSGFGANDTIGDAAVNGRFDARGYAGDPG